VLTAHTQKWLWTAIPTTTSARFLTNTQRRTDTRRAKPCEPALQHTSNSTSAMLHVQLYKCNASHVTVQVQCYTCHCITNENYKCKLQVKYYTCHSTSAMFHVQLYKCNASRVTVQVQCYTGHFTSEMLHVPLCKCNATRVTLQVQYCTCHSTSALLQLQNI
jgi:hypothetical protein